MKTRYIIALAAGALALVGCQREELADGFGPGDGQIRYSISNVGVKSSADDMSSTGSLSLVSRDGKMTVPATCEVSEGIDLGCGSAETKGELINTTLHDETLPDNLGFTVSAYKNDGSVLFSDEASKRSKTDDYWTMDPPQYWPLSTNLTFYAYTNAGDNTVSQTATSQTLTYTVTADAASHQDLMLGYYKGNGGNKGIAEMRFDHPLTAVRFKKGLMEDVKGIRSITISRLASGGTVTMDAYGDIGNWTVADTEEYETEVTLSNGDNFLEVDETTKFIGTDSEGNYNGAFLLIPQTLSDHGVTVTVVLSMDYGYDMTVIADITSGAWQAGKTYTYTLGYIVEDPNLLPGMFSVSPTEYVRFSKGNLHATRTSSTSTDWKLSFFDHQYDYIKYTSIANTDTEMSLFTWRYKDDATSFKPLGNAYGTKNWSEVYNEKNDLPAGRWYTLTGGPEGEWHYMLEERPDSHNYRGLKTVHGIANCLVIVPDDFDVSKWPSDPISDSDWAKMEEKGAVCLVPAGYRELGVNLYKIGTYGTYWAPNQIPDDAEKAYGLYFPYDGGVASVGGGSKDHGYSVRLVRKFKKQ